MNDFLNHYGDLPVRPHVTPTFDVSGEIDPESKALGEKKRSIFHTIFAKVLYVARRIRFDLCFAILFVRGAG